MTDPDDDVQAWLEHARLNLLPMIADSAMTIQIAADQADPKLAIELGYTLLLDKPLIIVAPAGRAVPTRLGRAADAVVEWSDDWATMQSRLNDAIEGVAEVGLLEEGRQLASQRDDLIAQGVDPADLDVPL